MKVKTRTKYLLFVKALYEILDVTKIHYFMVCYIGSNYLGLGVKGHLWDVQVGYQSNNLKVLND